MKNRTFLIMFLAAALSLGMTGTSFARGGSMGGGSMGGGSMGGGSMGGGSMGGGSMGGGSMGSFQSPRQEMSGPSTRGNQQGQVGNRQDIQQRNQDRYQENRREEIGSNAADTTRERGDLQGGNNGNHYGQDGGNHGQGEHHRAAPATPAQPGEVTTPAIPATPATPATPAG
jgi:hypothetical protein